MLPRMKRFSVWLERFSLRPAIRPRHRLRGSLHDLWSWNTREASAAERYVNLYLVQLMRSGVRHVGLTPSAGVPRLTIATDADPVSYRAFVNRLKTMTGLAPVSHRTLVSGKTELMVRLDDGKMHAFAVHADFDDTFAYAHLRIEPLSERYEQYEPCRVSAASVSI
jgi:hypothetical protein